MIEIKAEKNGDNIEVRVISDKDTSDGDLGAEALAVIEGLMHCLRRDKPIVNSAVLKTIAKKPEIIFGDVAKAEPKFGKLKKLFRS